VHKLNLRGGATTNVGELRRKAGVYEAKSVQRSTDRAVLWSGNVEWVL
jgi:hypothetical protein